MIGIYAIKNKVNGKIYVGRSVCVPRRLRQHLRDLRRSRHFNQHLQRAFNKYGEDQFELIVLEQCSSRYGLAAREQFWVDEHLSTGVYNTMLSMKDDVRITSPFLGKKHTEGAKRLMSERMKGKYVGKLNPFFGKKHSTKTRNVMSESKRGKYGGTNNPNYGHKQPLSTRLRMAVNNSMTRLTVGDVKEIAGLLRAGETHQAIADKYNVVRTVISRISNGTRWSNVTGGPVIPVHYDENGKRKLSEVYKPRMNKSRIGTKYKRRIPC